MNMDEILTLRENCKGREYQRRIDAIKHCWDVFSGNLAEMRQIHYESSYANNLELGGCDQKRLFVEYDRRTLNFLSSLKMLVDNIHKIMNNYIEVKREDYNKDFSDEYMERKIQCNTAELKFLIELRNYQTHVERLNLRHTFVVNRIPESTNLNIYLMTEGLLNIYNWKADAKLFIRSYVEKNEDIDLLKVFDKVQIDEEELIEWLVSKLKEKHAFDLNEFEEYCRLSNPGKIFLTCDGNNAKLVIMQNPSDPKNSGV